MRLNMRNILARFALLIPTASVAMSLRMFDSTLFMRTWAELIGKPLALWLGALIGGPLFELLYCWPAYLLAGGTYFLFAKVKYGDKLSLGQGTLLGAVCGAAVYLTVAIIIRDWLLHSYTHSLKLLALYTIAGAFYGWAYYYLIIRRRYTLTT